MGLEMATARIGTTLAMVMTVPLADFFGYTDEGGAFHTNIPAPILFCLIMLCVGTTAFFIYTFYDKKLDTSLDAEGLEPEEPFRMKDIVYIITNKGGPEIGGNYSRAAADRRYCVDTAVRFLV